MLIKIQMPTRAELMKEGTLLHNGWNTGPRPTCWRIYTWAGRRWKLSQVPGAKPVITYFSCETPHG